MNTVSNSHAPILSVRTFPTIEIESGGQHVGLNSKIANQLLTCLSLSKGHRIEKPLLYTLIWPDSSVQKSQGSLRQTIWRIQKQLDVKLFESNRQDIWTRPEVIEFDTGRVEANEDLASLRELWKRLGKREPALELTRQPNGGGWGSWVNQRRAELGQKILECLSKIASNANCSAVHRYHAALLQTDIDPTNEVYSRAAMKLASEINDIAAAVSVFQRLCDAMDSHQGMEPSAETQELVARIKGATETVEISKVAGGGFKLPQIDFCNVDPVPDTFPTYERVRRELIRSLIRFRELKVLEAPSVSDGTDGQYRLSMQLQVDSGTDHFAFVVLQDVVSSSVLLCEKMPITQGGKTPVSPSAIYKMSMALINAINEDRIEKYSQSGHTGLAVYDKWLFAEQAVRSCISSEWKMATRLLHQLKEEAPRFSRIWTSMAQLENCRHLIFPGNPVSRTARDLALQRARRAATLDSNDSRVQICLGWSHAMAGSFEGAHLAFTRAVQYNENDPWTLVSGATGISFCGDQKHARELARRAIDIDPKLTPSQWSYLAAVSFIQEDYESCVRYSDYSDSGMPDALGWKLCAQAMMGDLASAKLTFDMFYSEIASCWNGVTSASETAVAEWFLHAFPIRSRYSWHQMVSGFGLIGRKPKLPKPPVGSA